MTQPLNVSFFGDTYFQCSMAVSILNLGWSTFYTKNSLAPKLLRRHN